MSDGQNIAVNAFSLGKNKEWRAIVNSLYEHDLTKHLASSMVNKKTEIPT